MIKPQIQIKLDKTALENLKKELVNRLADSYVTVGIHDDAGAYDKIKLSYANKERTEVKASKKSNPPTVTQVALWNEFGTDTIPARPFIRTTIEGNQGRINAWRNNSIRAIMMGKLTSMKALNLIGFRLAQLIRNKINSNMPPPNAPSTKAKKLAAGVAPRTLVETGLLYRSVGYKVVS